MEVKLLGINSKEFFEKQINICAAAGKLSRMDGTVFDALDKMENYDNALNFIKRVIGMGHTSTIDHDYFVFALSKVSPIVEQTIIEERFSSFTIKSRREVDFSKVGFYTPTFYDNKGNIIKNNFELQKEYNEYMESIFKSYEHLCNNNIKKEDARFILPYCYHSEIIMGLDGSSLVRMINNLTNTKLSEITELNELGKLLLNESLKRAPYLKELTSKKEYSNKLEEKLQNIGINNQSYEYLKEPKLISITDNIDESLIINAISRIESLDFQESQKIFNEKIKNNNELKQKLIKLIFLEENKNDLKQINMRFQFSVPFAILTHYTRHRRLELSIPDFTKTNLLNYITPPNIKNNDVLNEFYENIFKRNYEMYLKFKNAGVREEDLIYFILSGNFVNIIINFDGEAFRWICRLRECTKAQWCIRENVYKMHHLLDNICPLYSQNLGPDCITMKVCGEGKESCGRIKKLQKGRDCYE